MTSKPTTDLRPRHARTSRLLAFVLLALVTYAATAETTHNHGNFLIKGAGLAATAVSNSADTGSALKDSRAFGDCLICQLQQHLSLSLFSSLPQAVAPQTQALRMPAVDSTYLSPSDAPT